jgi:hypothetical protein
MPQEYCLQHDPFVVPPTNVSAAPCCSTSVSTTGNPVLLLSPAFSLSSSSRLPSRLFLPFLANTTYWILRLMHSIRYTSRPFPTQPSPVVFHCQYYCFRSVLSPLDCGCERIYPTATKTSPVRPRWILIDLIHQGRHHFNLLSYLLLGTRTFFDQSTPCLNLLLGNILCL